MYKVVNEKYIVKTGYLPRSPYNKQETDPAVFVIAKLPVHPHVILSHAFVGFDETEIIDFRNRCELRFIPDEVVDAALDLIAESRKEVVQ